VLRVFVVFLVIAAIAAPAAASNVSIDSALERSELVVTIALDTPHATRVSIPVPSPVEGKTCDPIASYVVTGKVVKVLHPTKMRFTVVSEDERIVVFPGNIDQLVDLARIACVEGTSKSVAVDHMTKGSEPADGVTRTALLRWQNGFGWTEAVAGSWLEKEPSRAKLASVQRMRFVEDTAQHDALCVTAADCVQDDLSCEPCGPCVEHPPIARASVGRYVALCHEAKKPKPGRCGSCGDVKDPFGPPTRLACRAMRCVVEAVKPPSPPSSPRSSPASSPASSPPSSPSSPPSVPSTP
jgi:hypothetical protein